jgi:hypothetical protein
MQQKQDDHDDPVLRSDLVEEEQDFLLEEAKKAAAQGEPLKMLDRLIKSQALAGLVRRLQKKWPGIGCARKRTQFRAV